MQPRVKTIIGLFPELLGVGGIQEAGRSTAAALDNISLQHCNWSTNFQSLNDPGGTQYFDMAGRQVSLRGFKRSKAHFAISALRQSRNNAHIVLAAHPNLASIAAVMRWFSPTLSVIVMAHGLEVWKPLPLLRRKALCSANLVLAPSSDTAQKLARVQGVSQNRIRKLAWPLSPSFLSLADSSADLSVPNEFPRDRRVVLTVGRWASTERYKGADDLIRAMAQLRLAYPEVCLVAAGEGDDLPRLKKIAADYGVSDSVRFLTGLSRRDIAACYAQAEIFALPSTGEGFGLVFLEAMAFGKPIVGVACGGTTDVVEDGVNGLLIPPQRPERLVDALALLLSDNSLRLELGRRGADIVHRQYSFEVFTKGLERILQECGLDSGEFA